MVIDAFLSSLANDLRAAFDTAVNGLVAIARTQITLALAKVAKERLSLSREIESVLADTQGGAGGAR
jgi:hypothetical protein